MLLYLICILRKKSYMIFHDVSRLLIKKPFALYLCHMYNVIVNYSQVFKGDIMKIGIRKPSVKKSIKARTTGKVKRKVKGAVNPLYGKKGMGLVNDPKKAVYNKVYNKTSVGVGDILKGLFKKK